MLFTKYGLYSKVISLLEEYISLGAMHVDSRGSLLTQFIKLNERRDIYLLQDVIDLSIDVNIQDEHGYTAAHYLICTNHDMFDKLRMLARAGADFKLVNNEGHNVCDKYLY